MSMSMPNSYLYRVKELPAGVGIPPDFVMAGLRAIDPSFNLLWNNFGKRWEVWDMSAFKKPYIFTAFNRYPIWQGEVERIQRVVYINRGGDPFKWVKREQGAEKEKKDRNFSNVCKDIADDNRREFLGVSGNRVPFVSMSIPSTSTNIKRKNKKNGRFTNTNNKRKTQGKPALNARGGR